MNLEERRLHYESLFKAYSDILDTETVRRMLGGVCIATVWKLIRNGHLRHIHYMEQTYLVPKDWLIEYILSDHYAEYSRRLKVRV